MTRQQKIEALAKADTEDHIINKGLNANHKSFVRGVLAGIRLRDEELMAMEFDAAKFLYAAGYDNDKPLNDSEEWCVRGARSQFLQTQALIAARDARIKELEEYKWKYEQQHKTGEMK